MANKKQIQRMINVAVRAALLKNKKKVASNTAKLSRRILRLKNDLRLIRSALVKLSKITKLFERMHKVLSPSKITDIQQRKRDTLAWARQVSLEELKRTGQKTGKFEPGTTWWNRALEHVKELSKAQGKKR